jgi:DNA-binding NtrC family response regulator
MKTIMIVDDEINMLEEIKSCLESDNFEVITATNSREAIEHIRNGEEENVSLILVGTSLPDSEESALFSMKPRSRMNIDTNNLENFLQKPFTNEQLLDFVKERVKDI